MKKMIKVSIICSTYNQIDYIEEALKSFLNQKTNFGYEIIIHDDASTDGTVELLKEYEKKYSELIKVIYEKENKYSQGISFMMDLITNYASGDYIALCEGDDYWIDNSKLQVQYDALEEFHNCDICACWGSTVTEDGKRAISDIRPRKGNGILEVQDVILGGGQYLVTAGLFIRKNIYYDMMGMGFLDYALQIRGAVRGGIYYIDRKMAVYRRYSKGSWTNDVLKNKEKLCIQWEKEKNILDKFDRATSYLYHDTILQRLKAYIPFTNQLNEHEESINQILLNSLKPCFIWGLGRRGTSLEEYFEKKRYTVAGVCDAINENIGEKTSFGNEIFSTEYVLNNANTIFASTQFAYEDLVNSNYGGQIIDFQKFMPNG